jgi:hypothetical protein
LYDLTDVNNRLMAFQDLYNMAARPFTWTYATKILPDSSNAWPPHEAGPLPTGA